jgi:hypothetical protein
MNERPDCKLSARQHIRARKKKKQSAKNLQNERELKTEMTLRGQPCATWLQLCVFLFLELGSGFGFVLFPLLPSRTHTRHFSNRPLFANRIGVLTDTNHARKDQAIGDAIEDIMSPSIILVRPFLDKNVGTVARAMLNFGITDLRLVDPQCDHLSSDARALASGATGLASFAFPILLRALLISYPQECLSSPLFFRLLKPRSRT